VYVRFPSTSVGQGWVRFVRFQEVGRAQQMTEKGAKRNGKSRPKTACPLFGVASGRAEIGRWATRGCFRLKPDS
jgi:L-rhamnose isomerase